MLTRKALGAVQTLVGIDEPEKKPRRVTPSKDWSVNTLNGVLDFWWY